MRLPEFIRTNIEAILDEWTRFAAAIPQANELDNAALRDHARGMLSVIADDLECAQSTMEQSEKAKGRAARTPLATEAELHGVSRFTAGFNVNEAVAEFRALRASVLWLWSARLQEVPHAEADDITRFNESIDQAVAESLARFSEMKDRQSRLLETLLHNSPDPNYILETNGKLTYANKAFADLFYKRPSQLVGADFFALCAPFVGNIERLVRDVVMSRQTYGGEMRVSLKHGETLIFEYFLVPVLSPAGDCEAVAGSARDVTERKASEERIWRSANHDFLTDLPNRNLFRERLEHDVKHSSRTGLPLALLFVDLDRFKEVNDTLGHTAGDQLLRQVAQRISSCVRDSDTVARLGGDEFTVILTDVTEPQHIETIAAEILDELRKPFSLAAGEAHISCSIGITIYPGDGATPDDLVRNADVAMYESKNAGRSRYNFFHAEMHGEPS
jgi:diguanylate cyclase (GGDEF)-like protein/PAS domain S-box-containing protein